MDSDASRVTSRQGGVMRASKTFIVLLQVMEHSSSSRLRKNYCGTDEIQFPRTSRTTKEPHAGCSKRPSSKAAASEEAKAYASVR
jgi:hypothetical protein